MVNLCSTQGRIQDLGGGGAKKYLGGITASRGKLRRGVLGVSTKKI